MVFKLTAEQLHLNAFYGVFLQVFLSFAVSLTTMSDAISIGWTSTKIEEMTSNNSTVKISLEQASLIGTLPMYTYPFIMPLATYSANRIGRKWTIIWGAALTSLSWVVLSSVEKIEYIYAGVALRGLGSFVAYSVPSTYVAEISQPNIRGFLGTFIPISMNFGILMSYILVASTSLTILGMIGLIIILLLFPLYIWAPESPYCLFMMGKEEEAKESLRKFRNTDDNQQEFNDIKATVEKNNQEKSSIKEFLTDKVCLRATFRVVAVIVLQQLSGIDAILLFLNVILTSFGSDMSSSSSAVIFGVAKFASCAVSLVLMDKLGRRSLLMFSCLVASIALALLGTYFYLKDVAMVDISSVSWLPLTILIIYILGYNIGIGTVPFILSSELYPTKYKALGLTALQIVYCISMISVCQLFAVMKEALGFHTTFWILSGFTLLGILFTYVYIFETKGKTFKEILIKLDS